MAVELDLQHVDRGQAHVHDPGDRRRVPVERGVEVVEQARARHIYFRPLALLGSAAVDPDRAGEGLRLHDLPECERRAHERRAEQVVAAAVPDGLAVRSATKAVGPPQCRCW
jgi:hypothetical protein